MLLPALVALAAAVAFGWSTAAMHYDASRAPTEVGPLGLVAHLVRQPRWLGGMAASLTGLGLHTVALRLGSIAVVQPLVVMSLVFTFVFRALLERRLPPPRVLWFAVLTAAGLAAFLVAASSTTGSSRVHTPPALLVLGVGALVTAFCWTLSARAPQPATAGVLLGISAGVVFGLVAGTLKAVTGAAGLLGVLQSWPLYVLVCLGVAGFVLNQTAYRNVPLTSSVPILNVVNPLVALVYGLVAFSERPAHGVVAVLAEAAGLLAVLTGVYLLAREEAPSPAQQLAAGVR